MNLLFRTHGKRVLATALALFIVCISIEGFATNGDLWASLTHHREVVIRQPFKRVEIHGNVDVILTLDNTSNILIEGPEQVANAVFFETIRGRLVIRARTRQGDQKTTIYIPAASLTRIYFNGDGSLYSAGVIKHPELSVLLNGMVDVCIASASPLRLQTTDSYELTN